MTATYSHESQPARHETSESRRESQRRWIILAVVLCIGITGGILLAAGYRDHALGYEAHAAEYLSDSGNQGAQDNAPAATLAADNTPVCEEYTKLVTIGGESQTIYGTACRQPDGTWDIVQ